MTNNQPQRYGGLLGVAGGALGLGGTFTVMAAEFMPEADDAVAAFTDDSSRVLGGGQTLMVAAVLLLAFASVLYRRLRATAGSSSLPGIAALGYSAAAITTALGAATLAGGALRADVDSGIEAVEATTLFDIGYLFIGAATPALLGLAVGATALTIVRYGSAMPTWFGWVGVPIAVASLVMPINYLVAPLALLWTIAAGVMLTVNSTTGAEVDLTTTRRREAVSV